MFAFEQLIAQFTSVFPTSKTTIDLILTTDKSKISQSGVIEYGVSDHYIIYCTRKIQKALFNYHKSIKIRSLKNYNKEAFNLSLETVDWSSVSQCTTADNAWNGFKSIFLENIDKHAPSKVVRIKVRTEPWIDAEILNNIKVRDKRLRHFRITNDEQHFKEYKIERNKVQRLVKSAKRDYFSNQVTEHKNNPKKLWQSLKKLGCSNKLKSNTQNLNLDINGTITSNKLEVANTLNTYFTTVAQSLVSKLPSQSGYYGDGHVKAFYQQKGVLMDSFSLKEVSKEDVLAKLKALNPSKAPGLDNIPARFLRDAAVGIASSITHITNMSISQGQFPGELKLARVTPLFKKGNKLDPSNYRPVSILCAISKIMEKIIYEQIYSYVTALNLLFEFQSGFRRSHSTDTCLLYLTDHIRKEIDKGKYCGMVMLDLQKAFDTVNHSILLSKLEALGFNSTSLKWVRSYLGERQQVVDIGGTLSSPLTLSCGVPQGSILGPLFFLLYINDMKSACDCNLFLFADDSALLVSHEDKVVVENTLSSELVKVSRWLNDNKLSLNLSKTESILFGSNHNLRISPGLKVVVGVNEVVNRQEVTYLGCILDNKLTGENMALKVVTKVNQKVKFLARVSNQVDQRALKILASALVQCHFDYACTSWYSSTPNVLKTKLQTSQNKMIRLVLKLHPRTHLLPAHFHRLKWLQVKERVSHMKMCMVHRIVKNEVPNYLVKYFENVRDIHRYNTRGSSTDFVPYKFESSKGKSTFLYSAAVMWNGLPKSLKTTVSKANFKIAHKRWLNANMNFL